MAPTSPTGYSGTPLAQKLSLKPGMRVWSLGMPAAVREQLDAAGLALRWSARPSNGLSAAHVFVTERADLATHLTRLRERIDPAGVVWVSWPKKSAGVPTNITEDTIRDVALPLGYIDIKVCAIDETWSGLKLVIRKDLRPK
jgi:hypothetical protein